MRTMNRKRIGPELASSNPIPPADILRRDRDDRPQSEPQSCRLKPMQQAELFIADPGDPSIVPATLSALTYERGTRHPERTAFTYLTDGESREESLTFGELDRRAQTIAAQLASLGAPG